MDFDYDSSNYAKVGVSGYAYLRAYSTTAFNPLNPDCHGWSNAYFHQGRVPYSGGIYEGKFKAGTYSGDATPSNGIIYDFSKNETTGIHFLTIRAKITKRYVNQANAFASLLFFALFQYQWFDGSLSKYDYPQFTDEVQSMHYDVFISRVGKIFNVYFEDPIGTEGWDWGDAYNSDLHVQYVAGKMSNIGQWYIYSMDWGFLLNKCKQLAKQAFISYNIPQPEKIILRWLGVSAEVIGSELEVQIDYVNFLDFYDMARKQTEPIKIEEA